MLDRPERTDSRFPSDKEEAVRSRMAQQLDRWSMTSLDLALCGGARGADILFAELAHARGAEVVLLLPFETDDFIERSVGLPGTDWEARFRRLAEHSEVRIQETELGPRDSENAYARNNRWLVETARRETAQPDGLYALLLWDGISGDGPGGSSDTARRLEGLGPDRLAIVDPTRVEAFKRDICFANSHQPKRILCLDGGGVRGILTLQYLLRMETILRERYDRPQLVLADYFDLIAGTSTGAIIAAALALGKTVGEIEERYQSLATTVFRRNYLRLGALRAKFDARALVEALQGMLGRSTTLGSPEILTALLIIAKRIDTGSPWPLSNNPRATYFHQRPGSDTLANSEYPLWQVVRASTAAPSYFAPETIQIDPRRPGKFVDGGVSAANNPSLEALKLATLTGFGLRWPLAPDQLLLVSCGTGRADPGVRVSRLAGKHAVRSLLSVMADCGDLVETQMQWLSTGPTDRMIDRDIGDLGKDLLGGSSLLSYRRYNVLFESDWLERQLSVTLDEKELDALSALDNPKTMPLLAKLGRLSAEKHLQPEHFPPEFDLRS